MINLVITKKLNKKEILSISDFTTNLALALADGQTANVFFAKDGELHLKISRDRIGEFQQQTVPAYKQSSGYLEETIIQLYQKGITTREISDLNTRDSLAARRDSPLSCG